MTAAAPKRKVLIDDKSGDRAQSIGELTIGADIFHVAAPEVDGTQMIPPGSISEDPENARKEYDPAGLDALGENMLQQGQLQPVRVRPVKVAGRNVPGKWQLVFGHRRLRAAIRKKISLLRCEVVDATDDQVPAQQLSENEQRENLKALERSNAHQQMKARGLSIENIAKQTSISPATVRDSLKLQDLVPAVKKAWAEGKLEYSKALVIAKVPPKIQPEVLSEYFARFETNRSTPIGDPGEPLSVRQLEQLVRRDFMLELKKAPFAIADALLVKAAGACTTCQFRTGAQPELFAKLNEPDLCTNKTCYAEKCSAYLGQQEKAGRTVLSPKEAAKVFDEYTDQRLAHGSEYELASNKEYGAKKTYGQQVDKAKVVLAQNPFTGAVVEIVPRSAIPKEKREDIGPRVKTKDELKRERNKEVLQATALAVVNSMSLAMVVTKGTDHFLRVLAIGAVRSIQQEPVKQLCKRLGLTIEKDDDVRELLLDHVGTLEGAPLRRTMVHVAFAEACVTGYYSDELAKELRVGAEALGVDIAQVKTAAVAELDDEKKVNAMAKALKRVLKKPEAKSQITWTAVKNGARGKGLSRATFSVFSTEERSGGIGWRYEVGTMSGGPFPTLEAAKLVCEDLERHFSAKKKGKAA